MCGAYDCYACRGESALRYREEERWGSEEDDERERCLCGEVKEEAYGKVPAMCPECGENPDPEHIEYPEDAEVCTAVRSTVHVARKEHAGGTIQPGDTYKRTVYMGYIGPCRDYPEGGPRYLRVYKRLISKAAIAA